MATTLSEIACAHRSAEPEDAGESEFGEKKKKKKKDKEGKEKGDSDKKEKKEKKVRNWPHSTSNRPHLAWNWPLLA